MLMNQTRGDKIFNVINSIFMVLLCATMIYPLLFVFGRSFMDNTDMAMHPLSVIPERINLSGYTYIFGSGSYVLNSYFITIARVIVGTFLNLFFTSLMAYVLSKKYYPFRTPVTLMVVFTMWFSGGLVPSYLLINSLGLSNTFFVYILPGLISAWNMTLMRNFFMAIPAEIEESATIDGASDVALLFRIYLPLSSASLATIGLFYAVGHWNSWYDALLYVNKKSLWTLQMILREIIGNANITSLLASASVSFEEEPPQEQVKFATIVVATLPILCVYPFLQKYFVKGVMVGSLKG